MSIEYSIETAYGIIVASDDSDVALAIIDAYCDPEDPRMEEISFPKFNKDYPLLSIGSSSDSWSGSIKDNVIFYIGETRKDINPRDGSYDAFYTSELEPDAEGKRELNEFLVRFGIEDEPGICVWASVF